MEKIVNFQKIREEFVKAKNKIKKLFCGLGAVFILFIILISLLFISATAFSQDTIVSQIPDNTIFYAHISSLANDNKITEFFAEQMANYFKISKDDIKNKIFPFAGNETALAILEKNNNETAPFFIFKNSASLISAISQIDKEKNITIKNLTEKKLVILSLNNNDFQNVANFKNSAQIKKFAKKYSPDLFFYIDANKIYSAMENIFLPLDRAVLYELKNKNMMLAGIKKLHPNAFSRNIQKNNGINDAYEIVIADMAQNVFSKIKLQNNLEKKCAEKIIFSAKTIIPERISVLPEEFLKNFLDLEKEEIKIVLVENNLNNNNPESKNLLHDQLMLNGGNSPFQYVAALKNNKKNQENLKKIKTFFINYLDEKLPEEKKVELPDGTFMTELWSNPKRFIFKERNIDIKNMRSLVPPLRGDRGVLDSAHTTILWVLSASQLNFEFAYSETDNIILLSNSENTLKNYLSNNPDSTTADSTDLETFFINTKKLKDESAIINALNYFGECADGYLWGW